MFPVTSLRVFRKAALFREKHMLTHILLPNKRLREGDTVLKAYCLHTLELFSENQHSHVLGGFKPVTCWMSSSQSN